MNTWNRCLLLFLLGALFTAVFSISAHASKGHEGAHSEGTKDFFKGASKENGHNIYLHGVTLAGEKIEFEGGPGWLKEYGGGCANCHGDKAQGGFLPSDCGKKTPSIRLDTLLSGEHEHGGMKEKHTPYTIQTIRRGLESSVNPDGKPYAPCMPKWFLSDDDFRDLLFYLKNLSEQ